MAVLNPTDFRGRVIGIFVNPPNATSLATKSVASATLTFAGLEGDSHLGSTRQACVRTRKQYEVGTEIRNVRQLSLIGSDELAAIEARMALPGAIDASWLGLNLVIEGIPQLTCVPPSSRLVFENGPSLVVDMENEPCSGPAKLIDTAYPGYGKHFVKAAMGRRGVTSWVELPGCLTVGAVCRLHCPRLYEDYPVAKSSMAL